MTELIMPVLTAVIGLSSAGLIVVLRQMRDELGYGRSDPLIHR